MNSRLRKLLLPLLRAAAKGATPTFRMRSAASQALFLIGKPTPKKTSGRLRREQKRATHKEETAKIREACMERAALTCEAKLWRGGGHGWPEVMDHWLGGSGRRIPKQAVETCWMLCVFCNGDRTANYPDAAFWNEIRRKHCEKYGYPFEAHIIHAEPAKAGGAP